MTLSLPASSDHIVSGSSVTLFLSRSSNILESLNQGTNTSSLEALSLWVIYLSSLSSMKPSFLMIWTS